MLKSLAIIAALVFAAFGVSGQPNQAANEERYDAKQGQPAVVSADSSDKHTNSQTDQPKSNPNPPKWYTAIERPDWWLVGIAFFTGCVICWQSWETRKASQGTLLGAQASMAQIEHAKSVQRAQLRIEFSRPDFTYDAKLKGYPVHFRITLDGTTRAYVLEDSILAYLSESKRTGTVRRVFGIPRYLTPENSPYDGQTLIHNAEPFPEIETDMNKFHVARTGKDGYTLFADGRIWYRDIFGDEWVLDIDRYWDAAVESWGPVGSGRYDTHRKVDANYRDKAPKPS